MEAKSWTYLDRTGWPKGEWDNEPDKMQWQDDATRLPCLIVRNHGGALCGYVGVAEGHPAFEKHYDAVQPYPDVHGGLTFSDFCSPHGDNKERGICHVPSEGEPDRVWWLGFDCAHLGDTTPAYDWSHDYESSYKRVAYVQNECRNLAQQLAATDALLAQQEQVKEG